jgi:hypothetical protein
MDLHPIRGRVSAQSGVPLIVSWFLFAFAGLIAAWFFRAERWLAVGIAAAGLLCLWWGLVLATRARAIGSPTLLCAKMPFMVGEEMKATIEARSNRILEQGVKVSIACVHITVSERRTTTTLIWADDVVIPAAKLAHSAAKCRIPVAFEIPNNVPTGSEFHWHLDLYAVGNKLQIATFAVAVDDPFGRQPSDFAAPMPVERRINVREPGNGHISIDDKRPHRTIDVANGKITLTKWRSRQQLDATTIRAIEIFPAGIADSGPTYEVRLVTIGGKKMIAAPSVASRARANAIARKLEDILTGYDRHKVEALFGNPEGLNSTP